VAVPGFNRGNFFYEFYELSGQLLRPAPIILPPICAPAHPQNKHTRAAVRCGRARRSRRLAPRVTRVVGSGASPSFALLQTWEPPMLVGCSFGGANRLGEDHDIISTDRSSGGLVGGRSHDSHGSKWSAHWWIPASHEKPESLWLLRRLPSSLLRLLSSLPPSSALVSLLKGID